MNTHEKGILFVLLVRLRTQRLPRLLALHRRVHQGARLDAFDVRFLNEALSDTVRLPSRLSRAPEFSGVFGSMAGLYHQVTTRALHNEKTSLSARSTLH